jgi:hypothetical protein
MAIKSLDKSSLVIPQTTNSMLAGYSFQDYELIESVFVASPTASVTFNNLNQYATEYKHLQIRVSTRTSGGTTNEDTFLRINGDSGSNYTWHQLFGDGSVLYSLAYPNSSSMNPMVTTAASNTSGIFSPAVIDLLDVFSITKNKTMRSLAGHNGSLGVPYVLFRSGVWRSLNLVTSIAFTTGGNFVAGSRFSLYGIR